jgi:ketosteroid isomerase-like protein
MSHENVEIMRRANEAFNHGDIDGCLALYGRDIVFEDLMNAPDLPRVAHGVDEAGDVLRTWADAFEEFRAEIIEYIDHGKQVVCVTEYHGRSREGPDIHLKTGDVVEIRDGKITRVTIGYTSREDALEAAGLSE